VEHAGRAAVEPLLDRPDPAGADDVEQAVADEHVDVVRNGALRPSGRDGQLGHRCRPLVQQAQDRRAQRMPDRLHLGRRGQLRTAEMAEVVLYHHVQGLTDGVQSFAKTLRTAGHTVHTPDVFDGQVFDSIDDGLAFAEKADFEALVRRAVAAAEGIRPDAVYAGFSFGVMPAQQLAQTRPGAAGALLMCGCLPVSEFGDAWPAGVPVQVHGKEDDPFFAEDMPAAHALVDSTDGAELFLYPGQEHLFADASLPAYDADAAAVLTTRVLTFLDRLRPANG
jgi:dienelactone hydrolase